MSVAPQQDLAGRLLDHPELAEAWREVTLADGEILFSQGDPGDAFYSVVEGGLEVYTAGEDDQRVVLEQLGPGQHLGELSLVDGGERAAGVRALSDCRLRMLHRDDFLEALPRLPALAGTTIELLGTRMRRNAEYIGYVSRWARMVAEGDYAAARSTIETEAAENPDANIERFIQTFIGMIGSVQAREAELKRQLQKLRIEIDEGKYEEQLTEITESDFFRSLQSSAKDMRRRIRGED